MWEREGNSEEKKKAGGIERVRERKKERVKEGEARVNASKVCE